MQSLEKVSCNLTDLVRRCFFTGFVGEKFVEENSKDFYDPKGEIRFTICDTSDSEDELPYETEQVNKRKAGKVPKVAQPEHDSEDLLPACAFNVSLHCM